jgi:hypothetical protein
MRLLRDIVVAVLVAILITAAGTIWINRDAPQAWPAWIARWSK